MLTNRTGPQSQRIIGDDRMISIKEVAQSSAGGDLAFLSACDSALGSPENINEVVSLRPPELE